MSADWIMIDLEIPNSYYRKHSELSYTFMLWGKSRLVVPTKFMKKLNGTQTHFVFQMPKWWVTKNSKVQKFIRKDEEPTEPLMPLLDEAPKPSPTITIAEATKEKERTQEPIPIGQGSFF